jgi:CubicO group peptidase (beta-lactamase class C family)
MKQKKNFITFLVCFSVLTLILPHNFTKYGDLEVLGKFQTSERDYWPTEGWRNSTPEEQGMSSENIDRMMEFIAEQNISIHSVMVTRHGYVVHEEYLTSRYRENTRHEIHSMTKSFTSTLVGIAIDQGYIENVSQTILPFFPDYNITNVDERRERITIEHLLTMRAGMFWDEVSAPYMSPENDVYYILTGDGVDHCLNLDMVAEPGELWHYSGGASHLLAAIVQVATETSLLEFARNQLLDPLGIDSILWTRDGSGNWYTGAWGISLSTRNLAKFGYLFLNNGSWDGQQIISEEWVNGATSSFTMFGNHEGYGYQWWTLPNYGAYFAAGRNGQFIFVVPHLDIVAVFTSGIYTMDHNLPLTMFTEFILQDDSFTDTTQIRSIIINSIVVALLVVPALLMVHQWRSQAKGIKQS